MSHCAMSRSSKLIVRELLERPLDRDADVVYFLMELRKLMERLPARYEVLRFFCDWPLHVAMSRRSAKELLREFDAAAGAVKADAAGPHTAGSKRFHRIISFDRLRDDFELILTDQGLACTLVTAPRWTPFLGAYIDVINRTALVIDAPELQLQHIDSIAIAKFTESVGKPIPGDQFAFGVEWSLRKGHREVAGLLNEFWIPAAPIVEGAERF